MLSLPWYFFFFLLFHFVRHIRFFTSYLFKSFPVSLSTHTLPGLTIALSFSHSLSRPSLFLFFCSIYCHQLIIFTQMYFSSPSCVSFHSCVHQKLLWFCLIHFFFSPTIHLSFSLPHPLILFCSLICLWRFSLIQVIVIQRALKQDQLDMKKKVPRRSFTSHPGVFFSSDWIYYYIFSSHIGAIFCAITMSTMVTGVYNHHSNSLESFNSFTTVTSYNSLTESLVYLWSCYCAWGVEFFQVLAKGLHTGQTKLITGRYISAFCSVWILKSSGHFPMQCMPCCK